MILYTLATAFLFGLLRARVWIVPPLVLGAVVVQLGVSSDWNYSIWKPLQNPHFVDLVLKMLLANLAACVIGYGAGRLIASVMGWLGRKFRTQLE